MVLLPCVLFSALLQEPDVVRPTVPTHVTVVAIPSSDTALPGAKVSLFLDVTPRPGVHVYAPGAKDYLPISVTIDRQSGVTVRAAPLPAAQTMLFEGEKVPVYGKPFRIVQEATLDRTLKHGSTITVNGTVKYQACDDKVCYIPVSVPVSWTITVGPAQRTTSPRPF
jgi:DsbC/DsbD-like thiol-disulfide interchange protein